MAIIKNPFRKQDENVRPAPTPLANDKPPSSSSSTKQFDVDTNKPVEYKLSEINDSGVFIPPSPTEKKSFWGGTTASRSTTSSSLHKCAFNENEQFNISRESFDSYRRSFDISARSPIIQAETRPRASLDSRTFLPPPRMSNSFHRPLQVPQTQEEDNFEDVDIDDPKPQPPKKRGIFARMVDGVGDHSNRPNSSFENPPRSGAWHTLTGRKRGDSGRGAELGAMPKATEVARREQTPEPEKQVPTPQMPQQSEASVAASTQAPEIKVDS